jgi:apolipoprotein N-acyltransferase
MNRITAYGGAALSGFFLFLTFAHLVPFLGWVCLVPLFVLLDRGATVRSSSLFPLPLAGRSARSRFLLGFTAAATFTAFCFAWMIPGAHTFTGASVGYGLALFAICVLVYSSVCAMLLAWTPLVLVAPVWIVAETVLQWAATKMPWFLFHIGNTLATQLIAIQPMSVIGVTGAGFVVLLVNYGVARSITRRSWKLGLVPLLLLVGYLAWGWWLLPEDRLLPKGDRLTLAAAGSGPASHFASTRRQGPAQHEESTHREGRAFRLAIVREHIPPEIPWDSTNGNQRVGQLLQAEDSCVATGAQVIVWSESAIPWAYSPDDDLVKEVLRHSADPSPTRMASRGETAAADPATRPVVHILGMNTAVSAPGGGAAGIVRNSAYALLPDGRVAGRYDKLAPLLFIEQPFWGWQFPFFSSDGYSVEPGDNDNPLPTPEGRAGVLICNESALPDAAASRVGKGAQFLVNMSNDGWFRDTWLVAQHFYNARLRAVETRKDLVINSNNGWSGCIEASGRVDTTGNVFMIHPNDIRTLAVRAPLLPVYACIFFALAAAATARCGTRLFTNKKTKML